MVRAAGPEITHPGARSEMSGTNDEFRQLMERVVAGSDSAATQLLDRYGPAVLQAVRRRLSRQLRSKFDSLDFVQDVWASFFANPPSERRLHRPEMLVAFLARVARNKVVDATRQRLKGAKHNVNREHSLDHSTVGGPEAVPANQATPSEVVSRDEEWVRLLDGQPLVYRRILILLREGKTLAEIATELQIHPRTIRRLIDKLLPRPTT
jgi:RNA polymerase sigma factor (sigma-70 family)